MAGTRLSRREVLRTIALAGVAAVGSTARAAASTPEWQPLVAAAKKEGEVDGYKRALRAFTQAYPDIKTQDIAKVVIK